MILVIGVLSWPATLGSLEQQHFQAWGVDRPLVAQAISPSLSKGHFPKRVRVRHGDDPYLSSIHYTLDADLQEAVTTVFDKHRPDYGAFVAIEPESGRVLAMASYQRDGEHDHNLALRASYPAASVFKIITAATAIDLGKVNADTVIPFNGKATSLYRKNVLHHRNNQWTRHLPLKVAFAKSVNTVFARLGTEFVTHKQLTDYAERFGFNQQLGSDFSLETSVFAMHDDKLWSIAEAASGYTRDITLNPVHGAVIASAVVNGGYLIHPTLVDALVEDHGMLLYEAQPTHRSRIMSQSTTGQLRKLMETTVQSGSAKSSFKKFFRAPYSDVRVGGKTGTLSGLEPRGRYDWFVGYAHRGGKKMAFAALCINREYWYVKSAYVARKAIEQYFSNDAS